MLDKWIYFLKEASNLEVRPDILKDKDFDKAFERAQASNLTQEEKELYDVAMMRVLDQKGLIEQALDDGRAEGRVEGRAEGRAEGRVEGQAEGRAEGLVKGRAEAAMAMLKKGLAIEIIQQCTGFSKKEIESLEK